MASTKFVYTICVLFALTYVSDSRPRRDVADSENEAVANEYMDKVLENVRSLILEKHYDPYTALEYHLLGLHLVGELHSLSTLHRGGDVKLKMSEETVEISGIFGVYDLKALLDWKFQLGFFPISGKVGGSVEEVLVNMNLRLDLKVQRLLITEFKVEKIGRVKTEVKYPIAFPGTEYVTELISDAVANLLKNVVVKLFQGPIHKFIQKAIDDIDIPKFDFGSP